MGGLKSNEDYLGYRNPDSRNYMKQENGNILVGFRETNSWDDPVGVNLVVLLRDFESKGKKAQIVFNLLELEINGTPEENEIFFNILGDIAKSELLTRVVFAVKPGSSAFKFVENIRIDPEVRNKSGLVTTEEDISWYPADY
ncbi:hypothetical protein JW796_01580 [Candidatus Dojkabacteria bacterium]|nr:hypothetical protein [Candidatus Dojkabacteria bacterium]